MCGRYAFFTDREIEEINKIIDEANKNSENRKMKTGEIFPSDLVPVLVANKQHCTANLLTWGFPSFNGKGLIINARSETAYEKKTFKESLENRRCVIPSTGFYEWDAKRKKFLFNMADSPLLHMAGIYNKYKGENRFVILTTGANNSVLEVHKRMPVVLPKDKIETWLFESSSANKILFDNHPELIKKEV